MQQVAATSVSPREWRWVIILGGLLVTITLLPYAWAFTSAASASGEQFMGILYNPFDGATYLAKIGQGLRGAWQFTLAHTPEAQDGTFLMMFYLLLGHLASVLGFSELVMFHVARLVTGFMMIIAIYHLGSTIWQRTRPRRLFFGMIALGSGLGWLWLIVAPGSFDLPTDLKVPESIPLYATFVNPHFPLTIALIALLASMFVMVFRPGFDKQPTLTNGGLSIALITVAMCIVQPQGWVPIASALVAYIAVLTIRTRRIPRLELNWTLLVILPALPILLYYLVVTNANEALRIWNIQNETPSPTVDRYILGFGLLLFVALPGIWRALRRFERDGDRFMLIWLVVNVIWLYVPFNLQRRLAIGLIIPIVYFGVRSLEDFWFNLINRKWRDAALLVFFVFLMPSNVLVLGLPLVGVIEPKRGLEEALLIESGYGEAMRWLNRNARPGDVVLAPPQPSLWIPAYTSLRVVYGHPIETLDAERKLAEVVAFYNGSGCNDIVDRYQVRYILAKRPAENDVQNGWPEACLKALSLADPLITFDDVEVYQIPYQVP